MCYVTPPNINPLKISKMNNFTNLPEELLNIVTDFSKEKDITILAMTDNDMYWRLWDKVGCYTHQIDEMEFDVCEQPDDFIVPFGPKPKKTPVYLTCNGGCWGMDETEMCSDCWNEYHSYYDNLSEEEAENDKYRCNFYNVYDQVYEY